MKALHRSGPARRSSAGIARQGSTLRDYRLPDGGSGGMQHEFKVYGRGGEPCERCGTPIEQDPRRRARHLVLPGLPALGRARGPTPRLDCLRGRAARTRREAVVLRSLRFCRGRPDPPPLHARPRPDRRDREGRPQDEVALRRAARAALARRADAARGLRRAADGHRRRARPLAPRRRARTATG